MKSRHAKRLSNKQKQEILRQERQRKQERLLHEEQPANNEPRDDPNNFYLRFINDSDVTVEKNKADALMPFSASEPLYKVDETVYLREENCPDLPARPAGAREMDLDTYAEAERAVFDAYFSGVAPDRQTIATEYCQFELNENVYREVWRATERGDIIILIADARFPLPHTPVSIFRYFRHVGKPFVLLLNKADIVSTEQVRQWCAFYELYFQEYNLSGRVIDFSAVRMEADQSARHAFLQVLVSAARTATGIPAPKTITLSLMGQPSVGKSKTMNVLLGQKVTRVKLTAGCTKHLQTYYLDAAFLDGETDRSILLCDCPGLVFPVKNSPRPLQIVTGVFPTGRCREFFSATRLLGELYPKFVQDVLGLVDFQMIERKYAVEMQRSDVRSPHELLECLAYQLGYLSKGNSPWTHRSGLWLLNRVCEGKLVYEIPVGSELGEIVARWNDVKGEYQGERKLVDIIEAEAVAGELAADEAEDVEDGE